MLKLQFYKHYSFLSLFSHKKTLKYYTNIYLAVMFRFNWEEKKQINREMWLFKLGIFPLRLTI